MTSKERVKRAIHFKHPDAVPHFLRDGRPDDILWLWPKSTPIQPWTMVKEDADPNLCVWETINAWGTKSRRFGLDGNGEAVQLPLENIENWKTYQAPPLPTKESYDTAAIRNNPEKYILCVMGGAGSLFEGAHYLRGLADWLTDFYENPEFVGQVLDMLVERTMKVMDLCADLGADGVMGYDDWGIQDRPLMGMELWNEFYRPRYKKIWDRAHSKGLDVWMHSCGYTLPILKGWSEIGLNVAQLDQQQNMGLALLDRELGGKLAFWCPVDIQNMMINGSNQDITDYVKQLIHHLGRFGGGLVSMTYSTPDVIAHDPAKIKAACDAFRTFGVYS